MLEGLTGLILCRSAEGNGRHCKLRCMTGMLWSEVVHSTTPHLLGSHILSTLSSVTFPKPWGRKHLSAESLILSTLNGHEALH